MPARFINSFFFMLAIFLLLSCSRKNIELRVVKNLRNEKIPINILLEPIDVKDIDRNLYQGETLYLFGYANGMMMYFSIFDDKLFIYDAKRRHYRLSPNTDNSRFLKLLDDEYNLGDKRYLSNVE